MDFKSMNPLGIIGIIGAIILVVGVFLSWMEYDYTILGQHFSDSASGWDIFDDGEGMDYNYAPLLCLIVGIISIVLMVMPIIMNTQKFQMINNILGLIALILSVVSVIITVLFWQQDAVQDFLDIEGSMGAGFWLCLAGGIVTMIGGLMPVIKNKLL